MRTICKPGMMGFDVSSSVRFCVHKIHAPKNKHKSKQIQKEFGGPGLRKRPARPFPRRGRGPAGRRGRRRRCAVAPSARPWRRCPCPGRRTRGLRVAASHRGGRAPRGPRGSARGAAGGVLADLGRLSSDRRRSVLRLSSSDRRRSVALGLRREEAVRIRHEQQDPLLLHVVLWRWRSASTLSHRPPPGLPTTAST